MQQQLCVNCTFQIVTWLAHSICTLHTTILLLFTRKLINVVVCTKADETNGRKYNMGRKQKIQYGAKAEKYNMKQKQKMYAQANSENTSGATW